MASKSINVHGENGAGKKTLIGSLIFRCGLEMQMLEQLKRNGIHQYADVVPYFEREGIPPSFYAKSAKFLVERENQTPDVVFWLVDATDPGAAKTSSQRLASMLAAATMNPKEKLLILVNKMDLTKWSEDAFQQVARQFRALSLPKDKAFIIPVSSTEGTNMLSSPQDVPWMQTPPAGRSDESEDLDQTLMDILG
ncbi:Uu.00g027820.m01.CDS01 [Anthostomella pinea]|uniref:Uu.00g027820.m01.CDS01 n=1 Tax=Anthostomella pinea TaxID=933095 RepID=A0AAI8V7N6_9PEZI|nr:Uu.00g027820.m01.CDS01 [Anthostomella pinea]